MPLDATRMTNFVDTDLHQGWEVTFTLSIVRRRMPAPDTIWHEHSTPTRQIPAAPVRREALLVRRYAEKNGPLRQIYWSNTAWIPPWILASDFRIFTTQMSHRTAQLRSQNTHDTVDAFCQPASPPVCQSSTQIYFVYKPSLSPLESVRTNVFP